MAPSFNELPWHDAELRGLSIDRRDLGIADDVNLAILWPDGVENEIRLLDCYGLMAEMNFGIIARETILTARMVPDAQLLAALKAGWARMGVHLDDLTCFEIETASTGSTLRIYAKRFELRAPSPKT